MTNDWKKNLQLIINSPQCMILFFMTTPYTSFQNSICQSHIWCCRSQNKVFCIFLMKDRKKDFLIFLLVAQKSGSVDNISMTFQANCNFRTTWNFKWNTIGQHAKSVIMTFFCKLDFFCIGLGVKLPKCMKPVCLCVYVLMHCKLVG